MKWVKMNQEKKVMIAGTFDLIHPGHIALIKEASKLGAVTAIIGTDNIVYKLKGRKPVIPEEQRVFMVSQLKNIREAVLGYESLDFSRLIKDIAPDIIFLGPDQGPSEEVLQEMINKAGINVFIKRMSERINEFPLTSTTSILKKIKNDCRNEKKN